MNVVRYLKSIIQQASESHALDLNEFSSAFIIDTNFVFHTKPILELPWQDIDPVGPIILLALPQLLSEVDKKKRDGRLSEKARQFNRYFNESDNINLPIELITTKPKVYLSAPPIRTIDWNRLPDLDQNHPDDILAAQALNIATRGHLIPKFFGFDNRPCINVRRHGGHAVQPPSDWLLPNEPHPKDKVIQQLKAKVAVLESNKPKFDIQINLSIPKNIEIPDVQPLTEESKRLFKEKLLGTPRPRQNSHGLFDLNYSENMEIYQEFIDGVPRFLEAFPCFLSMFFSQFLCKIRVENIGEVTADKFVLEIHSEECELREQFVYGYPEGPSPHYKSGFEIDNFRRLNTSFESYEFVPSESLTTPNYLSFRCQDFRHKTPFEIDLFLLLRSNFQSPGKIIVRATTANGIGETKKEATINFSNYKISAETLFDFSARAFLKDVPLREYLKKRLESGDLSIVKYPQY